MTPTYDATENNNGGDFEPQQAAALLNQTTQQAKRQLEPFPPRTCWPSSPTRSRS